MSVAKSLRNLLIPLGGAIAVLSLNSSLVAAADVLDCAAALRAASNPHNVGQVGNSGSGWMFGRENPAILSSAGEVRKEGLNDEVRGEVQSGDMLAATIKLFDMRQMEKRTKPAPQAKYRIRWIAPREVKLENGKTSRCSDEEAVTIEAGAKMLHTIEVTKIELDDISGIWQMISYDLKGNPLSSFDYKLENARSKDQIAADALKANFSSYMVLNKCITLNMAPLSKDEYRSAISLIDKAARQKGIDTDATWKNAASDSKIQLDNWDQRIATSTGMNWETRQALRKTCAVFSGDLMEAAREASGTRAAPKKDF